MTASMDDWQRLGLGCPTTDVATIKRAYAITLRTSRPDEDAAAYQALREAFDRLLKRARTAPVAAPPASDRIPPSVAIDPDATVGFAMPTPQELCTGVVRTLREQGPAIALGTLPALMHQLEALPLGARREASIRFADVALHVEQVPAEMLIAWRDHFGWTETRDFRTERAMGHARLTALSALVAPLMAPVTDPAVLGQFNDLTRLNQVFDRTGPRGALGLAMLLADPLRAQWARLEAMLRHPECRPESARGKDLLSGLSMQPFDKQRIQQAMLTVRCVRFLILTALLLAAQVAQGTTVWTALFFTSRGLFAVTLATLVASELLSSLVNKRVSMDGGPDLRTSIARPLFRWGVVALFTCSLGMLIADRIHHGGLLYMLCVLGAVVGALLAMPDTVEDSVVAIGTIVFVHLAFGGMAPLAISLLTAWIVTGTRLGSPATWTRLRHALGTNQRRRAPARAVAAATAMVLGAAPAALCWATARLGYRVVLGCGLLAWTLRDVGSPGEFTTAWRLALLALCLAAAFGARHASERLGRWIGSRLTA